jgi:ABC-type antimicrobial peptide transport system permease subunit
VNENKSRTLHTPPTPLVYVPLSQNPSTAFGVFVRDTRGAAAVAQRIVNGIHAIDPNLSPYEIVTMQEQVTRSTAAEQIAAALVGIFAGVAVLLSAIGVYGVIGYAVSQRAREFSLRVAVGAAPSTLVRLVVGSGLRLAALGSIMGTAVALLSTRLLGDLLFRVSPRDPRALVGAFVAMVVVCAIACFIPAWRAARSDPVVALRS